MQSRLPQDQRIPQTLEAMTDARRRAFTHHLRTASRAIIDLQVTEGIGTLVNGKNVGWKQETNLGKKNPSFVFNPHARLIGMLTSMAELVGAALTPSKNALLVCKRVKRGLFVSSTGQAINADINGSYNILPLMRCPEGSLPVWRVPFPGA
jgi:transposase